ncbi:MAG: MBL fold metallo-hydrolase [Thermoprotei archaeon]
MESAAEKIGEDVYLIDPYAFGVKGYMSLYFIAGEKPLLFDVGPASSAGNVVSAIESLGYRGKEIEYIVVSHGHVDHAGGLWEILKWASSSHVVTAQSGLRHLSDPSKNVQAFGTYFPQLSKLAGTFTPIAPDRIEAASVELNMGDKVARLVTLPGHAHSQIGLQYGRILLAADSLSTNIVLGQYYLPPSYPPHFDFSKYTENLDHVLSFTADTLCISHFGVHQDVASVITKSIDSVKWFRSQVEALIRDGSSVAEAAEVLFSKHVKGAGTLPDYMVNELCRAAVAGMVNSIQKLQTHR